MTAVGIMASRVRGVAWAEDSTFAGLLHLGEVNSRANDWIIRLTAAATPDAVGDAGALLVPGIELDGQPWSQSGMELELIIQSAYA